MDGLKYQNTTLNRTLKNNNMAKPIFIVRLPSTTSFEMASNVREKMGHNLGDEYNVLILVDMKRKSKEIQFECYNAEYNDIEWMDLAERVNVTLTRSKITP